MSHGLGVCLGIKESGRRNHKVLVTRRVPREAIEYSPPVSHEEKEAPKD